MAKNRKLWDAYRFPGFRPAQNVTGIFGDPKARVIQLVRRGKKQSAEPAVRLNPPFTIEKSEGFGTFLAGIPESTWMWKFAGWIAARAGK